MCRRRRRRRPGGCPAAPPLGRGVHSCDKASTHVWLFSQPRSHDPAGAVRASCSCGRALLHVGLRRRAQSSVCPSRVVDLSFPCREGATVSHERALVVGRLGRRRRLQHDPAVVWSATRRRYRPVAESYRTALGSPSPPASRSTRATEVSSGARSLEGATWRQASVARSGV